MANKPIRVVIDTNLWISFLISNNHHKLDKLFAANKITVLFSQELLEEFLQVVSRPKFRKHFTNTDLDRLLAAMENYVAFITIKSKVTVCRDSKDNFLLSLCEDGKADFLLTGDQDLLVIRKHKKITILKMTDFLNA